MKHLLKLTVILIPFALAVIARAGERLETNQPSMLHDHAVVLDKDGRLLPWTSFDRVIRTSMNFIEKCPTVPTRFGDDPWYLVTSKLTADAKFMRNQNCQGTQGYWAVETLVRYYPYSGDVKAIESVRLILDRLLFYHTPSDWAWANVPRTQDNTPDGEWTDETGEPDKMASVAVAYIKFYKMTGEKKYLDGARAIAMEVARHVAAGDAETSPLPFRINLKTGKVIYAFTAHMISPVQMFYEMIQLGETDSALYKGKLDVLWKWILSYPLKNEMWSGYYEDVNGATTNKNQQTPMETARFMLQHPEMDSDYRKHVDQMIDWVKNRFGRTKRFGATSIREQDGCFYEMSSHTSRYASIVARKFALSQDPADREEARASFALATYSTWSKYSHDDISINYVGVGYVNPWFTDSYFDFLAHILDGMSELPEMAPDDSDHIISSTSIISNVSYRPGRIEYNAFESRGREILRITFSPKTVTVDGKALPASRWTYGVYRGVPGILQIVREIDGRSVVVNRE